MGVVVAIPLSEIIHREGVIVSVPLSEFIQCSRRVFVSVLFCSLK